MLRPRTDQHPDDEILPGLLLLRLEGRFFFANAGNIVQKVKLLIEGAQPKVVALYLRSVIDLEYTALKMLTEAETRMRELGVRLWLVGMNPN